MPDEAGRFQTKGLSWSERAKLGGLSAVISPSASARSNAFLGGVHEFGAHHALALMDLPANVVDFGCGNGRFTRFFADRGCTVLGTEITPEMLEDLQSTDRCRYELTDGVHIPVADGSQDLVWCCGVLRFSMFGEEPQHANIAAEMFRALRPGGLVVNVEVFVEEPSTLFVRDFERAGFRVREDKVLHRYGGRFEHHLKDRRLPDDWMPWLGKRCAQLRYYLDKSNRQPRGLRDYLLVLEKPQ